MAVAAPAVIAAPVSTAAWQALNAPRFEAVQPQGGALDGPLRSIAEDTDGLMWAVSGATLWRWDGDQAVRARLSAEGAAALEEAPVMQTVRADDQGELWAGTARGVYRIDRRWPSRPALVPVPLAGAPPSVLFIDFPAETDREVVAYFGTVGAVLALQSAGGVETRAIPDAGPNRLHALHVDAEGQLWAGTTFGLFRWSAAAPSPRWVQVPLPVAAPRIAALASDPAGRLWVGTANHGLFSIDAVGAVTAWPWPSDATPLPRIFALAVVRPGELWVGSFGQGVWALDTEQGVWSRHRHDRARSGSLDDDNVWSVFTDSRGLAWVGTSTGLQWSNPGQRRLLNLPLAPEADAPASRVRAHGMAAAGSGVWFGTNAGRLRHLGIAPPPADTAGLLALWGRGDALAGAMELVAPMGQGRWVLGSDWRTVLAEPARGRVRPLQPAARGTATYTSAAVAWDGAWWLSGPDGLWRIPLDEQGEPRLEAASNGLAEVRGERRVSSLLATPDTLWIGTWSGLARLDRGGDGVVRPVPLEDLDGHFLSTLLVDATGRLWVGTSAGGVFHAAVAAADDPRAWSRIDETRGLPGNSVGVLLQDLDGRIWASTSRGLARIDPSSGTVRAFRPDQGAAAAPYVRRSGAVLPGGQLVFGGTDALTVVLPDAGAPPDSRPLPRLVITDIATSEDEPTPLFDPATSTARARLRVPPGVSRLALEFAAPAYVGADGLRYRYRLQGWDERWSEVDAERRVASFTHIAPGSYRFDVEVAESAGPWQEPRLSVDVDVIPAWHQHRGVHAVFALALLTIAIGAVQWRARRLRERAHELERMVDARTAALAAANAELEQAHRAVEEASLTDPLTGLHNRRFLWRHIDAYVALALRSRYGDEAGREPSDLLFFLVDVDHFKRINDQHGHAVGDLVLVEMGRRLRAVFRESDHVVRWGGEEFLGVARGANRDDGPRVAERICAAVAERPFVLPGGEALAVRCSVGFAALPLVVADRYAFGWEDTVAIADEALYEAKAAGRDGWAGFEESGDTVDSSDLAALRLRSIRAVAVRGLVLRRSTP